RLQGDWSSDVCSSDLNQFKAPWDSKQFGVNMGRGFLDNKLFVFGSYEGTRIDNPNPIFERVPTAFDRTLDPYLTGTGNGFVSGRSEERRVGKACRLR